MFRDLHVEPGPMGLFLFAFAFFLTAFVWAVVRALRRHSADDPDALLPLTGDTQAQSTGGTEPDGRQPNRSSAPVSMSASAATGASHG